MLSRCLRPSSRCLCSLRSKKHHTKDSDKKSKSAARAACFSKVESFLSPAHGILIPLWYAASPLKRGFSLCKILIVTFTVSRALILHQDPPHQRARQVVAQGHDSVRELPSPSSVLPSEVFHVNKRWFPNKSLLLVHGHYPWMRQSFLNRKPLPCIFYQ